MERTWIVVAFGDLKGFGQWTSRAANSPEVKEPFLIAFYKSLESYVQDRKDVYFKYLGDGFMVCREFDKKDSKEICKFLKTIQVLTNDIKKDIRNCGYPQPDGFRIRIAAGDVYKVYVLDPNDPSRKRKIPEFLEYATNQAAHLLKVNPDITCLATEIVVKALGKYRSIFRVRELKEPSAYPESVNSVDIKTLKVLKF